MHLFFRVTLAFAGALIAANASAAATAPDVTAALEWRLVGPFRARLGHHGRRRGRRSGYVLSRRSRWRRLEDGRCGRTWRAVFDGVGSASVGALAVALRARDDIYAGMGQVTTRYDIAAGDGVYRSDDGGAHLAARGPCASRHIGAILVDPRNADRRAGGRAGPHVRPGQRARRVPHAPTAARPGATLFVSENTGAVDLAVDPADPQHRVRRDLAGAVPALAQLLHAGHRPGERRLQVDRRRHDVEARRGRRLARGQARAHRPGGSTSRAGHARLRGRSTPSTPAACIAPTTRARPGSTSTTTGIGQRLLRAAYAAPDDPDTVYAMGRASTAAPTGGKHCEIIKGAPGGDDYHHLWINPKRPERMITGADQGTVVTSTAATPGAAGTTSRPGSSTISPTDNAFPVPDLRRPAGQRHGARSRAAATTARSRSATGIRSAATSATTTARSARPRHRLRLAALAAGCRAGTRATAKSQNITPWPISATASARPLSSTATPGSRRSRFRSCAPYPLYFGSQLLFRSHRRGRALGSDQPRSHRHASRAPRGCDGEPRCRRARATAVTA